MTDFAFLFDHKGLEPFLHIVAHRLFIAAPQVGDDSRKSRLIFKATGVVPVLIAHSNIIVGPIENSIEHIRRELTERCIQTKVIMLSKRFKTRSIPR